MKNKLNTLRDILVGKVPDPKSQVEQITIAMVFKFMDDMDKEFLEDEFFGGERKFFVDTDKVKYSRYSWSNIMNPQVSGQERADLYREGVEAMQHNPNLPDFFKDVFRNAYIPFRDSETINLFLKEINEFTYNSQNSEDLGEAYEMLLSIMSSQGEAGQFRTPRHIIDMIVNIVQPSKNDRILDPACGTAGFLISAYKYILNQNLNEDGRIALTPDDKARMMKNFEGYDISQDMVRLSRVNMYLHHFSKPKIYEYDTLTSQDRWDDQYDVIFANPPFMTPKGGINPHNRFRVQANRSEILFVDYIVEHLSPTGRAGIIVPEGIVFQSSNAYKQLRKYLVDDGLLYAVISLPAGVFNPYSGVKTSILLIDKPRAKCSDSILFVKMNNDGFDLGAQRRESKQNDIPKIIQAISLYKEQILKGEGIQLNSEEKDFCTLISKEQISDQDYILVGERYRETMTLFSKWDMVELGQVCDVVSGFGFPKELQGDLDGTIPFYKVSDMNLPDNQISMIVSNNYVKRQTATDNNWKLSPANAIVFPKIGAAIATNKKRMLTEEALFDNNVMALVCSEKILKKYLFYIVQSIDLSQWASESNPPSIRKTTVEKFKIPLPPLSIQEEFVSEIQTYQNIIDGAKQVVENYKPTFKVDSNWETVKLGDLCEINPQKSIIRNLSSDTLVSFVPMASVSEQHMYLDSIESRKLGEVYKGYTYFGEDDVILAKVTPCFENGKSALVRDLHNGIGFGSSEFYVLRADKNKVLPELVYYTICSKSFIYHGKNNMTGTGGLQRVTKDYVMNYPIMLPPMDIQKQIASEITAEMEIVQQNRILIKIFEQKIVDKIGEIWNSEPASNNIVRFPQIVNGLQFAARNCSDKFIESVIDKKDGDSDE